MGLRLQLSPRLRCIAGFVRPGDRVIDVGTDHAYIPIWLLQNGLSPYVIATDLRPGPLQRADADGKKYGVSERLELRLGDGLRVCTGEQADTIILAGMGGETILNILAAAPWTREKRLILQPQSKQGELRSWLAAHGYAIADAALAYDTGRVYLVWLVTAGEMRTCPAIDTALIEKKDPLLKAYAQTQSKRLRRQLCGLESARSPDAEQLSALRRALAEVCAVCEEAETW